MTRISFIVPTFNRARYLGEALDSILSQMGSDDELLVIDDGSTDGTAEVAATRACRVRYIRQDNAGKAVALNRGMAETTGRYVWICDDDDVQRPGIVEPMVELLESSGAGFVFGRYSRFSEDGAGKRTDMGTGYWPDLNGGSLVRHILEDAFVMQNAALVRREAYAAVGPFAERMLRSLDYEMFVRLAVTVPAAYLDRLIFDQRKHDGVRGPASMLHAASASDNVWAEFDRRIFENLHRAVPLALFEGMFACDDQLRLCRAALLQRAAVMVRHGCWDEALVDLETATAEDARKLDAGEIAICRRALSGKHGFAGLAGSSHASRLRVLSGSKVGREIVSQMFAGTLWRIRRGSPEERSMTVAAMRDVLGTARSIALPMTRGGSANNGQQVFERTAISQDTLLPPGTVPPAGDSSEDLAR